MQIHTKISSLKSVLSASGRVAFVPTMGNLHEGHLSLMRAARAYGDVVVSSIFVNRLQFGPGEDFERYPRTLEEDCSKLESANVDHLFAPEEAELYPQPQNFFIQPGSFYDSILEGACRPGHFSGVATVVAKLFNIVRPDVALFGKKDYQQLIILRNMVRELNMPIRVLGCGTIRETDGLALSSRNAYLVPEERADAHRLYAVLNEVVQRIVAGELNFERLEKWAEEQLRSYNWQPDYVAIRRQEDLQTPSPSDALVVLGAARLGNTRVIDNIEVSHEKFESRVSA